MSYLLATLAMSLSLTSEHETAYILKHVANDHVYRDIIKFVKRNDKGELILGGLYISSYNQSHDEFEAVAQKLKDPQYVARMKEIMHRYEKAHFKMKDGMPKCLVKLLYGIPSHHEITEEQNFLWVKSLLETENCNSQDYPEHTAIGWKDFEKQDPELAREIQKDPHIFDHIRRSSNARVLIHWGSNVALEHYLRSGYGYCFNTPYNSTNMDEKLRISEKSQDTKLLFVHKDALPALQEKLKASLNDAFTHELEAKPEDRELVQIKYQQLLKDSQA